MAKSCYSGNIVTGCNTGSVDGRGVGEASSLSAQSEGGAAQPAVSVSSCKRGGLPYGMRGTDWYVEAGVLQDGEGRWHDPLSVRQSSQRLSHLYARRPYGRHHHAAAAPGGSCAARRCHRGSLQRLLLAILAATGAPGALRSV